MEKEILKEEYFAPQQVLRKDDNAIFIDFDRPDKALEKLLKLKECSISERTTYTKHLAELLQIIGDPSLDKLNEILTQLANDIDDIRRLLLLQIPQVVEQLKLKNKVGYGYIRDVIIPVLFILLANNNLDIKEDAGKEVANIAQYLSEDDRGKIILTKVLCMAHDDGSEDNRIVSIQLLSKMAQSFGVDLCDQFVGLEILSLGEDPQIRVRKESVLNLHIIGKVVSKDFFQNRLLRFYLKKSQEPTWGIRKACVDTIVEIAKISDNNERETKLTEVLINFLTKDPNKWVKISAYKNLGPFIAQLQSKAINEKLIEQYVKMPDAQINDQGNDNEIIISCAYYFPAVLQSLGAERWPFLQKTFNQLIKFNNKKVRRPLACSLHEIAKILGAERAEKDLFQTLESLLKDQFDEVKYGAIENLANFIQVFDTEKRENLLDVFLILQKDPKKWRIRELIAQQIKKLTQIFSPETIFKYIVPISFKLCNDTVFSVRQQASKKIYAVLKSLYTAEGGVYREVVIGNIRAFSASQRFNLRQTFALMCNKLLKFPELFEHFAQQIDELSFDKVVNVRITLAKMIQEHVKNKGASCNNPVLLKIIERFQNDQSLEVRKIFNPDIPTPDQQQNNQLITKSKSQGEIQQQQQQQVPSFQKDQQSPEEQNQQMTQDNKIQLEQQYQQQQQQQQNDQKNNDPQKMEEEIQKKPDEIEQKFEEDKQNPVQIQEKSEEAQEKLNEQKPKLDEIQQKSEEPQQKHEEILQKPDETQQNTEVTQPKNVEIQQNSVEPQQKPEEIQQQPPEQNQQKQNEYSQQQQISDVDNKINEENKILEEEPSSEKGQEQQNIVEVNQQQQPIDQQQQSQKIEEENQQEEQKTIDKESTQQQSNQNPQQSNEEISENKQESQCQSQQQPEEFNKSEDVQPQQSQQQSDQVVQDAIQNQIVQEPQNNQNTDISQQEQSQQ